MSIDTNTPVESVETEQTLEEFSNEFFGRNTADQDQSNPTSEDEATDDDALENESVNTDDEDDTLAEEEVEPEVEKPKKSRFQERIDELTHKAREEERRARALEAKLEEVLKKLEPKEEPKPAAAPVIEGPQPDMKNEDGTDKYPLGEFDPAYIRDLTRHTLKQEREQMLQQEREEQEKRQREAQVSQLDQEWQEKIVTARERYPDFTEKGQNLVPVFEGLDENYLDYLTTTVMQMDYGTDVLYYLASNPDEAEKIAKSGPQKATIALGRIEARFAAGETTAPVVKVSKAPPPPPHVNKGTSAARVQVEDDTDDLAAFKAKFFKKQGRR